MSHSTRGLDMAKCTVKMSVDICGESALDAVTNLVVNEGMPVKTACRQVADEFNSTNKKATVKWTTLKQSYVRANKVAGDMSPAKKAPKIPIVDTTITIPMAEYSTMKARIIELEMHLNATIAELDKHLPTSPSTIVNTTTTTTGKLPREIAFNYIKEHGNQFQSKAIAAETLHNTQLLNILQVVIEKRLKKVPHSGIPKDILAATEIV
jgi:hypothetical protein